jgi:N-acetylglucosamine-6-phosphate deacetylase
MRLGVRAALVDGRLLAGDVAVEEGVVTAVGLGGGRGRGIAAPGFVDLQVNGFAGVDLIDADADGWARVGEALLAGGTTAFQPTFITAPEAAVRDALRSMPPSGDGPRILGAHLEGPFLSAERLGVHPAADRRDPDPALLGRLLDAGPVRQVTLAPELAGALELVDALVARGITVSAGHSAATADEAHRAFGRGVRTVTHLHNAMAPGTPREPGLATAALARPDVVVQVIVDGHHLAADTVRVAWRAAAGRFALVTDAVAAGGAGDGEHRFAGRVVYARCGEVRDAEGRLAGSALTMIQAVRNLHGLGIALEAALGAAATVPARVAGRPELGRLAVGAPADVVVLDDRLDVQRTLVGGEAR